MIVGKVLGALVVLLMLVLLLMMGVGLAGCSGEMAAGTVAGAAAVGSLDGIMAAYEAKTQETIVALNAAQERLTAATNDTERQALQAQVDALKAEAVRNAATKEVVEKSKEIVATDWSTPAGTAAGSALIANILTVLYMNRKKKDSVITK